MSWKKKNVIKLIKAYRKQPILWDPRDPDYSNEILINHAWKDIAQQLDTPVVAVRSKVEILSGRFRREKKRLQRLLKQAGIQVSSPWYAYKHLKFLRNKNNRKRLSNMNSVNTDNRMEESAYSTDASPPNIEPEVLEQSATNSSVPPADPEVLRRNANLINALRMLPRRIPHGLQYEICSLRHRPNTERPRQEPMIIRLFTTKN